MPRKSFLKGEAKIARMFAKNLEPYVTTTTMRPQKPRFEFLRNRVDFVGFSLNLVGFFFSL